MIMEPGKLRQVGIMLPTPFPLRVGAIIRVFVPPEWQTRGAAFLRKRETEAFFGLTFAASSAF
jgi:hypothetical protein